jgi:hypothetical protein
MGAVAASPEAQEAFLFALAEHDAWALSLSELGRQSKGRRGGGPNSGTREAERLLDAEQPLAAACGLSVAEWHDCFTTHRSSSGDPAEALRLTLEAP